MSTSDARGGGYTVRLIRYAVFAVCCRYMNGKFARSIRDCWNWRKYLVHVLWEFISWICNQYMQSYFFKSYSLNWFCVLFSLEEHNVMSRQHSIRTHASINSIYIWLNGDRFLFTYQVFNGSKNNIVRSSEFPCSASSLYIYVIEYLHIVFYMLRIRFG